jgi:hypothetical protein
MDNFDALRQSLRGSVLHLNDEPGNEVLRQGERIANAHERDARGTAELGKHLPHKPMRLDSSADKGICRLLADPPSSVGEERQLVPRLVAGLYNDLKKV